MKFLNKRKLILASASPRRKQLMSDSGFEFDVMAMDVDETYPEALDLYLVAEYIAEKKANAALSKIQLHDEIVITADSIVVLEKQIFGKPIDAKDAYKILAHLSGKKHIVYTGVCLADKTKLIKFTGKSEVYFRDFTHDEIVWYIEQFKPYDKAGSYAVQEWIGLCKISSIEGSYANIMGLPTDLVYEGLKQFDGALRF